MGVVTVYALILRVSVVEGNRGVGVEFVLVVEEGRLVDLVLVFHVGIVKEEPDSQEVVLLVLVEHIVEQSHTLLEAVGIAL